MERGAARINNGAGEIDTPNAPQPVSFAPTSFPDIVNGEDVFFERVSSNPRWAAQVVSATGVNQLLGAAVPSAGLTPGAHEFLMQRAVQFVAEARAAPTPAHRRAHLSFAKKKLSQVASSAGADGRRVGVATVRKALA